MSWAEAKWTVDSLLQKLGQAPNNMRAFSGYGTAEGTIYLCFLEPADSYDLIGNLICAVGGVMIRMSDTDYPASPYDGTLVIDNTQLGKYENAEFTITGLDTDKTYYFSAFPYSTQGVYNLSSDDANRFICSSLTAVVYGISRDITNSSPAWTRTDSAIGMTATASIGTTAGSSDFDSCYPWSNMTRRVYNSWDTMVKIPKFYYRHTRSDSTEYIKITGEYVEGFTLHPAFNHAGVETDWILVGAYKTSTVNDSPCSKNNEAPQMNQTRTTMRTNAKSKGTGWGLIDISTLSAIQMLILVEFANNDVQSVIGRGYCQNSQAMMANIDKPINTGSCDSVSNRTGRPAGTDGLVDVVWRGIEGFWGNLYEFVDGINYNCTNRTYYVCNNPANYADDTTANYTPLSYTSPDGGYIKAEGFDPDNSYVILPETVGGSESTYDCDQYHRYNTTGWSVLKRGGFAGSSSAAGLFTITTIENSTSVMDVSAGSRLLYIPS